MNIENTENPYSTGLQEAQISEDVKIKEVSESFTDGSEENKSSEPIDINQIEAFDQSIHDETLEKLDIIKKEEHKEQTHVGDVSNKVNNDQIQAKIEVEKFIAEDFDKIQKLQQFGLINSAQGQNLKQEVLKKAFDKLVEAEKVKRGFSPMLKDESVLNKNEGFEEFSKSNPDFFTKCGRKEVLDYLKSGDVIVGKDELTKISEVIRIVEKSAIERYLKKTAHEKALIGSNEVAKQRLTANAQRTGFSDSNLLRTFTRDQIGKMSGAEFAKYESVIMEQLRKGLIK